MVIAVNSNLNNYGVEIVDPRLFVVNEFAGLKFLEAPAVNPGMSDRWKTVESLSGGINSVSGPGFVGRFGRVLRPDAKIGNFQKI